MNCMGNILHDLARLIAYWVHFKVSLGFGLTRKAR
jgi:hypothetical protein